MRNALAIFIDGSLPTLLELSHAGRMPVGLAPLQTDRRECLEDPGSLTVTAEHCAEAFEALLEHLQVSARPHALALWSPCALKLSS